MASDGPENASAVEFVLLVEAGPLEAQAVLLVDSLRRFGGRHAGAAITVVSPRPARRPARATVRALGRLGAEVLPLAFDGPCPEYPTSWRVHALARIESRPGPAVLVQLDSDTVFLGDVGPLCDGAPACARPVDLKGMGTTGPGDPYEPYWRALCALERVAVDALPWVRATADGARIRATHNGGFVAAVRELGLFGRADDLFRRSVAAGLRPHAGSGLNVVAGAGEVGVAGSEWWGSSQAVVAVAAAGLGVELAPLETGVNVPLHLWDALDPPPAAVTHAHYHWLLDAPDPHGPLLDGRIGMDPDARAWLAARVPLARPRRLPWPRR